MATSRRDPSLTGSSPGTSWPLPNPGQIVWCRFPNRDPADPTLKNRPALVVSVMDQAQPPRLRVAYGTTQRPIPYGPGEFLIQLPAHLAQAGLVSVTKFSMRNLVVLDWTPVWFGLAPRAGGIFDTTPTMGTLPAELMRDAARAHSEVQAGR